MAGEGEAQISAGLARESASIKRERALEKPEANRKLAKAGELASHVASMRVRSQSAREAFRGEHMKERGEGEAFAFRELRIRSPGGEKAWDCEAELLEARGELARRARRLRAHCRRSEKERRRSHEKKGERRRRRRKGRRSASEERPAKLGHELLELLEALLELSLQSFAAFRNIAQLESARAKLLRLHADIRRDVSEATFALESGEKGGGLLLELESIRAKARRRRTLLEKREVLLEHEREGLRLLERGEGEHRPGELAWEHRRRREARSARRAELAGEERRSHEKKGEGLPI
jgi:hypothetical protein